MKDNIKTYDFDSGVFLIINHTKKRCDTVLIGLDKVVPAIITLPEDLVTAKELGYGEDVWTMNWHHEFLHSWLSDSFGEISPTLLYVAKGGVNGTLETIKEEERVLKIQKELNEGKWPILEDILNELKP